MRGPRAQVVVLAREDRERLERIERAATSEQREVLRARIILQAAEAASNEAIGRGLGVTDRTARKWRARYVADGMEGLKDRRRSGRPARLDGVVRCQVIRLACRPVPQEYCRTEWTLCSIRNALLEAEVSEVISTSTIGRILRHADLKPHRYRMWVHSADPEFARKVRDVVGLYLRPPRPDQVVLCIDEKTGMQALRRRFAARLPRPGEAGRWEFEYRRHGTRTLLAAFNVHTAFSGISASRPRDMPHARPGHAHLEVESRGAQLTIVAVEDGQKVPLARRTLLPQGDYGLSLMWHTGRWQRLPVVGTPADLVNVLLVDHADLLAPAS
jgi:transposase